MRFKGPESSRFRESRYVISLVRRLSGKLSFSNVLAESVIDTYHTFQIDVLKRRLREAEQDIERLRKELLAKEQLESQDIRAKFEQLAEQWRDETGHMSSAISITQHPAYLRIIAMGPAVVPLILQDLQRTKSHWVVALRLLTGANPVKPEDKGKVARLADAWLEWGRERGLV